MEDKEILRENLANSPFSKYAGCVYEKDGILYTIIGLSDQNQVVGETADGNRRLFTFWILSKDLLSKNLLSCQK